MQQSSPILHTEKIDLTFSNNSDAKPNICEYASKKQCMKDKPKILQKWKYLKKNERFSAGYKTFYMLWYLTEGSVQQSDGLSLFFFVILKDSHSTEEVEDLKVPKESAVDEKSLVDASDAEEEEEEVEGLCSWWEKAWGWISYWPLKIWCRRRRRRKNSYNIILLPSKTCD